MSQTPSESFIRKFKKWTEKYKDLCCLVFVNGDHFSIRTSHGCTKEAFETKIVRTVPLQTLPESLSLGHFIEYHGYRNFEEFLIILRFLYRKSPCLFVHMYEDTVGVISNGLQVKRHRKNLCVQIEFETIVNTSTQNRDLNRLLTNTNAYCHLSVKSTEMDQLIIFMNRIPLHLILSIHATSPIYPSNHFGFRYLTPLVDLLPLCTSLHTLVTDGYEWLGMTDDVGAQMRMILPKCHRLSNLRLCFPGAGATITEEWRQLALYYSSSKITGILTLLGPTYVDRLWKHPYRGLPRDLLILLFGFL